MKRLGTVIIPEDMKPLPEAHEIEVAQILARHYACVVEFLQPTAGYKMKTPDIVIDGRRTRLSGEFMQKQILLEVTRH